jgi:Spy/CpxP family protein refolding chaperone
MSPNPGLGSRTRLIGAGLLVATFLAGALAGTAVQVVLANETPAQKEERGRPHDCDRGPRPSPFQGLGLTSDQESRIDAVLENRKVQLDVFWKQHGPRMRAITDSTRAEIQSILTPEQRSEMDRRREKRRARCPEGEQRSKSPDQQQHHESAGGKKR